MHLLDITRRILRYGRIGRVKFINDDAKPSRSQPIQLKNLSLLLGWVGTMDAWCQLPLTLLCRNDGVSCYAVAYHLLRYDNP
jgi:hypothetical protein